MGNQGTLREGGDTIASLPRSGPGWSARSRRRAQLVRPALTAGVGPRQRRSCRFPRGDALGTRWTGRAPFRESIPFGPPSARMGVRLVRFRQRLVGQHGLPCVGRSRYWGVEARISRRVWKFESGQRAAATSGILLAVTAIRWDLPRPAAICRRSRLWYRYDGFEAGGSGRKACQHYLPPLLAQLKENHPGEKFDSITEHSYVGEKGVSLLRMLRRSRGWSSARARRKCRKVPKTPSIASDFLSACREGSEGDWAAGFDYHAGRTTQPRCSILGNLGPTCGRKQAWSSGTAPGMKVSEPGRTQILRRIDRPYRKGWNAL